MEQRFPLEQGNILCQESGGRMEVLVQWKNDGRGLYKAYLQGKDGSFELGALLPEGDTLRLRRSVSVEKLNQASCWPVTGGRVALVHPFGGGNGLPSGWRREEQPARLFHNDPILKEAAEQMGPCLLCQSEAGFGLAVPYHPSRPFVMLPIFCFARMERLGGQVYTVFRFHPDESPRWPPEWR